MQEKIVKIEARKREHVKSVILKLNYKWYDTFLKLITTTCGKNIWSVFHFYLFIPVLSPEGGCKLEIN